MLDITAVAQIFITSSIKSPAYCEISLKEWATIMTGDACCDWIIVNSSVIPAERHLPSWQKPGAHIMKVNFI